MKEAGTGSATAFCSSHHDVTSVTRSMVAVLLAAVRSKSSSSGGGGGGSPRRGFRVQGFEVQLAIGGQVELFWAKATKQSQHVSYSPELLVSPLIPCIVFPYIMPYTTPFKEFRL